MAKSDVPRHSCAVPQQTPIAGMFHTGTALGSRSVSEVHVNPRIEVLAVILLHKLSLLFHSETLVRNWQTRRAAGGVLRPSEQAPLS